MKRGDIVLVNLEPTIGAEANKTRPAVVVSNNAANTVSTRNGHGTLTVVPLTTNTTTVYPFQVLIYADPANGLTTTSKAQAEQIRSIDARRLARRLGTISPADLARLDAALTLHLALRH